MPIQTGGRTKARGSIRSDQETFRFTTPGLRVVSRPEDLARPRNLSPDAQNLMSSLENIMGAAGGIGKALQKKVATDKELGSTLAATNQPLPDDASDAVVSGYRFLEGQKSVTEYVQGADAMLMEASKAIQDAPDADSKIKAYDDYAVKLEKLADPIVVGRDQDFLKGFAQGALKTTNEAHLKLHQTLTDSLRDSAVSNMRSMIGRELQTSMDSGMSDDEISKTFHTESQQLYDWAEKAGITKDEVTALRLDEAGTVAVRGGRPGILKWIFEKDENGIRTIDTKVRQKANQYYEAAIESQWRLEQHSLSMEKAKAKAASDLIEKELEITFLDPDALNTPEKYNAVLNKILKNANVLDASTIKSYRKILSDARAGGDYFSSEDNMDVKVRLWSQAENGALNISYYNANKNRLTKETAFDIWKHYMERKDALSQRRKAETDQDPSKKYINEQRETLKRICGASESFGLITKGEGAFRFMKASKNFEAGLKMLQHENKATTQAISDLANVSAYAAYLEVPDKMGFLSNNSAPFKQMEQKALSDPLWKTMGFSKGFGNSTTDTPQMVPGTPKDKKQVDINYLENQVKDMKR